MTGPNAARPEPGPDTGIDDIQADIEQTRHELGQTVDDPAAPDGFEPCIGAREPIRPPPSTARPCAPAPHRAGQRCPTRGCGIDVVVWRAIAASTK